MTEPLKILVSTVALLAAGTCAAQDLSLSAYGTLGWARATRDLTVQRWIDGNGTFDRDSVLGVQADLRLAPQWSATLQLKAAPSLESDDRWDLVPAWAFAAWRPSDDWLLRAGRMRVPLYLHSESMDVGVTHDMARLPAEMYSIVPSSDFNGASVAKTWAIADGELALDGYWGRINTTARFWFRDGAPPARPAGANFVDVNVRSRGLVLTWRGSDGTMRAGLHRVSTRRANGDPLPVAYPFVPVAPGIGYYQVDPSLPGPGWQLVAGAENTVFSVGLDQPLAPGWRVMAEYARIKQSGTELGSDSGGGYVALLHRIGRFTPYASVARLRSSDTVLGWQRNLTETQLPPVFPGADAINAGMRVAGESGYAVDQRSWTLGSSYAIDSRQKLKLEYQRMHVGQASRMVDTPPGQPTVRDTSIGIWSLNYSFGF